MENYYRTLSVSRYANDSDIRASYLTALKKYHPDIYPGDKKYAEEITANINIAYNVLSSPEKRAKYDRQLDAYLLNMNDFPSHMSGKQYQTSHVKTQTEYDYDSLPVFSFFKPSKFSEALKRKPIKLTKEEKQKLKKEKQTKKNLEKERAKNAVKEAKKQENLKKSRYKVPSDSEIKSKVKESIKDKETDESRKKLNKAILFIVFLLGLLVLLLVFNVF